MTYTYVPTRENYLLLTAWNKQCDSLLKSAGLTPDQKKHIRLVKDLIIEMGDIDTYLNQSYELSEQQYRELKVQFSKKPLNFDLSAVRFFRFCSYTQLSEADSPQIIRFIEENDVQKVAEELKRLTSESVNLHEVVCELFEGKGLPFVHGAKYNLLEASSAVVQKTFSFYKNIEEELNLKLGKNGKLLNEIEKKINDASQQQEQLKLELEQLMLNNKNGNASSFAKSKYEAKKKKITEKYNRYKEIADKHTSEWAEVYEEQEDINRKLKEIEKEKQSGLRAQNKIATSLISDYGFSPFARNAKALTMVSSIQEADLYKATLMSEGLNANCSFLENFEVVLAVVVREFASLGGSIATQIMLEVERVLIEQINAAQVLPDSRKILQKSVKHGSAGIINALIEKRQYIVDFPKQVFLSLNIAAINNHDDILTVFYRDKAAMSEVANYVGPTLEDRRKNLEDKIHKFESLKSANEENIERLNAKLGVLDKIEEYLQKAVIDELLTEFKGVYIQANRSANSSHQDVSPRSSGILSSSPTVVAAASR